MPGTSSANLMIPVMEDAVFGPTKVLTAVIDSTDPSLEIGTNGEITVTVEDNDGKVHITAPFQL